MQNIDFENKIIENIKSLREKHGYTAYKVAKLIKMAPDAYYAYESGRRKITVSLLSDLSKLYKVSVDDIIDNEITYNREKTISFDVIAENTKKAILIDSQNDQIIFFEKNEFELDYFVKCNDLVLNRKVLAKVKEEYIEAFISRDESSKVYAIFNIRDNSTTFFSPKKFIKNVVILGDYAGTIIKQLKVKNFL